VSRIKVSYKIQANSQTPEGRVWGTGILNKLMFIEFAEVWELLYLLLEYSLAWNTLVQTDAGLTLFSWVFKHLSKVSTAHPI
jgi:hypothetical protein